MYIRAQWPHVCTHNKQQYITFYCSTRAPYLNKMPQSETRLITESLNLASRPYESIYASTVPATSLHPPPHLDFKVYKIGWPAEAWWQELLLTVTPPDAASACARYSSSSVAYSSSCTFCSCSCGCYSSRAYSSCGPRPPLVVNIITSSRPRHNRLRTCSFLPHLEHSQERACSFVHIASIASIGLGTALTHTIFDKCVGDKLYQDLCSYIAYMPQKWLILRARAKMHDEAVVGARVLVQRTIARTCQRVFHTVTII